MTRAKTGVYDVSAVEHELPSALKDLDHRCNPSLFGSADEPDAQNEFLRAWFHPHALRALLIYRSLIPRHEYQDLMKVVLSRAARSARLTTHYNLDFPKKPQTEPYECHKHGGICKPTTEAYQFIRRYTLDTIDRVKEFAETRKGAKVEILWDNSRTVELPRFDMIMTSPPYVGLIDYHEQHRYAYELLDLPRRDDQEIGAASKGKSVNAHQNYLAGIKEVFLNARKYMRKKGVAVIVIGDRENLHTDGMAGELGFRLIERLRRHVNRRTGRRNSDFFEDVLIWERT